MLVKLVHYHGAHLIVAHLHHYPHPMPVAFIPDIGYALYDLVPNLLRNALDKICLVNAVGEALYYDVVVFSEINFTMHDRLALSGPVCFQQIVGIENNAATRKIRSLDMLKQIVNRAIRVVNSKFEG